MRKSQLILDMIALELVDTKRRSDGFRAFPAASLPRLRFDCRVARKFLIRNGFSIRGDRKKIFSLSFPARQGKKGAATEPSPFAG
jgi:hypothetical protein